MEIYKYYQGEVHTLEVRETKKMYIKDEDYKDLQYDSRSAFGWKRQFFKDVCCTTHDQAIREAKNRLLTRIGMHQDGLDKANNELNILAKL